MFYVTVVPESSDVLQMSMCESERERELQHTVKDGKSLSCFSLEHFALDYILLIYYTAAEGGFGGLVLLLFFWQSL